MFFYHPCADPSLVDQVIFLFIRGVFLYGSLILLTGLVYRL